MGDATDSLCECLCKGQPYYTDIQREHSSKNKLVKQGKYLSGLQGKQKPCQ